MNNICRALLLKNNMVVNVCSSRSRQWFGGIWKPRKSPVFGVGFDKKKNIKQILEDKYQNEKDPTVDYLVDIGFPFNTRVKKEERNKRHTVIRSNLENKNFERLSRANKLTVPLDEYYEEWLVTDGPHHVKRIAEHYAIFEHLYGDAYFHPVTPMKISFKSSEDEYTPVYFGNVIKPKEAQNAPFVDIGNKSDLLHTLVLSNLDGHLNKENGEYVQWMVGNIPAGDVTKGELLCSYLPPFPTKGTGYHRYVFVLYQQDKKLDFSNLFDKTKKISVPESRNFNTYEFYKARQDEMTPSSLLFFQTDWDSSVTNVFHNIFDIQEPRYEYEFPKPYYNPQVWYPIREPFNTYMDRFRDPKQISKEVLVKKFKTHHPFKKPDPPLKYPNAHTSYDYAGKASWIQVEAKKDRLKWGKLYNDNVDIIDPK